MLLIILIVDWTVMGPFFQRIGRAMDIMCGGNLDFVYASDPITKQVIIQPTSQDAPEKSAAQNAVLQHAFPEDDWTTQRGSGVSSHRPSFNTSFAFLQVVDHGFSLDYMFVLQSDTIAARAEYTSCADGGVFFGRQLVDPVAHALSVASSTTGVSSCAEVRHMCHLMNASLIRLLCPNTCSCNREKSFARLAGLKGDYGAFVDPAYGCPKTCAGYRRLNDIYFSAQSNTRRLLRCEDMTLRHPDPVGQNWSAYRESYSASGADAIDWTLPHALEAFYDKFLRGLFQFLRSRYGALESALLRPENRNFYRINESEIIEIVTSMVDGRTQSAWVQNDWVLAAAWPKTAYPQLAKQGCDFLADFDFSYLYGGLDLCSGNFLVSIAPLCPQACGCQGPTPPSACPKSCARNLASTIVGTR